MNKIKTLNGVVPIISLTPSELQNFVKSCEKIKDEQLASMGVLFQDNTRPYEMDGRLYNAIVNNLNPNEELSHRFRYEYDNFVDPEQIIELCKKNPITWPYAPTGIIQVKNIPQIDELILGLRLAPFNGESLGHLSRKEYIHLLTCIRNIIDDIKCYADNEIAHKHIFEAPSHRNSLPRFNVIQNEDGARIIGTYGPLVSVGKDFNDKEAEAMFTNVLELINYYCKVYGLPTIHQPSERITETTLEEMYRYFSDGVSKGRK